MPTTGSRLLYSSVDSGTSYDLQDDIAGDCVLTQERYYGSAVTPPSASPASFARSGVASRHDACNIGRSVRIVPSNPYSLNAPTQSPQGFQTVPLPSVGCPSYPNVVLTMIGRDMAHSLSPSTLSNTDELTPEMYSSDPRHGSYSRFTTSGLEEQFSETQLLQEDAGIHPLQANHENSACQHVDSEYSIPLSAFTVLHSSSHHIAPSPTTNPSTICNGTHMRQSAMSGTTFMGDETDPDAFAWSSSLFNTTLSPATQQANSPGFMDGSPKATPNNETSSSTSLDNPIVRVENYSRGELSPEIPLSRTVSKRSCGSRRSSGHLSPYQVGSASEDELIEFDCNSTVRQLSTANDRNEDGSWKAKNHSGQAGLHPHAREQMKNIVVPSLNEQEEQRNLTKKNAQVEKWLTHSEVCSEVEDSDTMSFARRSRLSSRSRAKSASDASMVQISLMKPSLTSSTPLGGGTSIPGPGINVEVHSESKENVCSESESVHDSPPARIGSQMCDDFHSKFFLDSEKAAFTQEMSPVRPWTDAPCSITPDDSTRYQPPTSNAAMMRFRQRAKDLESASLAATIGSMGTRRMSESDIDSLFASSVTAKPLTVTRNGVRTKGKGERRSSFLENILPKRSNSNLLKRKRGQQAQHQLPSSGPLKSYQQESEVTLTMPNRVGSWKQPKSPTSERGLTSLLPEAVPLTVVTATPPTGPWARIKRSRSRSDIGKSPGLAELMTQHGGPPILALTSPATDVNPTPLTAQVSNGQDEDDTIDDDDVGTEPVHMGLSVRSNPVEPTYEGFRTHARQLNPRLAEHMIERVTQEQVKRYKRLLDFKVKHFHNTSARSCSSGAYCLAQGGSFKDLPPRPASKDGGSPFAGFQIVAASDPSDGAELVNEGIVAAQFPPGIPLPPVKRLPAEFECSVCFKVKKFYKPSDWTKHIHEDIQPFTCTFPNCGEPKSFKRKADWVRHENERHRQLEKWTCDIGECSHTCFRKDNFVQHLVREHKVPEPKVRTSNAANRGSRSSNMPHGTIDDRQSGRTANVPSTDDKENVWAVVERCRHDNTARQPKDEPCRFCGNICNSWKKLTVHLAKHMEQISMPILALVEQKLVSADTVISPIDPPRQSSYKPSSPSVMSTELPTCLCNELQSFDGSHTGNSPKLDADTRYSQFPSEATLNEMTSSTMHIYPQPQLLNHRSPMLAQSSAYMQSSMPASTYSYPGASLSEKHDVSSVGNMQHSTTRLLQNSPAPAASTCYMTPMPPISIYDQQDVYSSPVDAAPFGADLLSSSYFPQGGSPSGVLASNSLQAAANPAYAQAGMPNYDSQYGQVPAQLQSREGFAYHQ